jgi:hypothetical protein
VSHIGTAQSSDREDNSDLQVKWIADFMLALAQVETQGAPKEVRHNHRTCSHNYDEKPRLSVTH